MTDDTTLVNLHRDRCTRHIDRRSRFGNPFRIEQDGGEYTREESIRLYEGWFLGQVKTSTEFREAVEELRGETLGCWCVEEPTTDPERPYDCHGELILAYLAGTHEPQQELPGA